MNRFFYAIFAFIVFSVSPMASFGQQNNSKPVIVSQTPNPLTTNKDTPVTIALSNLIVTDQDPSPVYPNGFTLEVSSGKNYKVKGTTVTPDNNFTGQLIVPVQVKDGKNKSDKFDFQINVIGSQNVAPQITGQSPLSVNQGGNLTIEFGHLTVTDPDNAYPTGFTLKVFGGNNYTFNGNTITPSANFSGKLTVPVSVNDGQNESNRFDLKIDVAKAQNTAPKITGQSPLTVNQGQSLTVEFGHLTVTDPDNAYPTGFTLKVFGGNNYTFNGNTITPSANFSGKLTVPVSVNDGQNESDRFDLKIDVAKAQNVAPQIIGQQPLSVSQGKSLPIEFGHLTVTDPDDNYPAGFTLKVFGGNGYTFDGNAITPSANFSGTLKVPVTVNDGQNESNRFDLKIDVVKNQNAAPQITGQSSLSVNQGQSTTITLTHLTVTDPDNTYPNGFSLKVYEGNNYALNGNTVTPSPNFSGSLKVAVSVNDGQNESNHFDLKIDVLEIQNAAPQITGQESLTTNEDEPITLQLSHLRVTDPDNPYPTGFSLKVGAGKNYSVSGLIITPSKDFSGPLPILVSVNDGKNESAFFNLNIDVTPVNDPPVITGQVPLSTNRNTFIPIEFSHLQVRDPDNRYPDGFTLNISNGANYSFARNLISPTPGFTGTLNVMIAVNDGKARSAEYKLIISVLSPTPNVAPVITGQKEINLTENTSLPLQLSHLNVSDPDSKYPDDFTLKVLAGNDYKVEGTTITPNSNLTNTVITVIVKVNDGQADSAPFELKIRITPLTSRPQINGHRMLVMMEDSTLVIGLSDLMVTDADDPDYPAGFSLIVLSGGTDVYAREGNSITPAKNLNGFIEVGVVVSDGVNKSEEFKLSILINPVNDPPEITVPETTALAYEPGSEPISIFESLALSDVDNDHLIMTEVGFRPQNYSALNDQIIFHNDTSTIRAIVDANGTLFLIGYATIDEYQTALHSLQYNYRLTQDEMGNPAEILSGPRTLYLTVSDGQLTSPAYERQINMEVKISLDIPNVFTPNGDHENDTWHVDITNSDKVDDAEIRVYDKRGSLIYQATGFEKEWDGISNGQVLPVDSYYYTIDLNLPYMKKTYKGVVSILH